MNELESNKDIISAIQQLSQRTDVEQRVKNKKAQKRDTKAEIKEEKEQREK